MLLYQQYKIVEQVDLNPISKKAGTAERTAASFLFRIRETTYFKHSWCFRSHSSSPLVLRAVVIEGHCQLLGITGQCMSGIGFAVDLAVT